MPTHERELHEPVDLCTPDGRSLLPAARGWSRTPLHRPNLKGQWGRTKKWDYWAVLTGDGVASVTFADLDYVGLVAVEWADFSSGVSGGRVDVRPLGWGIDLPDRFGAIPLEYHSKHLTASVTDDEYGTHLVASWTEPKGGVGALDVTVELPQGHESLNVVIPWSESRFQYTSKHQARPATGTIDVGGANWTIGGTTAAWGVLDVGRGRWPYRTNWNWAGGAGPASDGRAVGIQMGAKWTEGTGFTENGMFVDGTLIKIGEELTWNYDWDNPMQPWCVRSADGIVDLVLTPKFDRESKTSIGVLRNEGHQVFGTWSGQIPDIAGGALTLGDDVIGFAEETRARW